ncbi:arsenic metallochaperone ArsD family protein [Trichococcus sp. K1Tr]|uniref:arsenic metallochaperone ArsD family protein n=1 Tax=Trichococcus sp. K1Tr TaxID=3020847 RepID=UPI00232B81E0|nr:arsenic metallochaperone ArsD family protein [Trichococcus sp. K1Tr]MDB6352888.1 arsenic metallochaperone ArsD family protein [Trichococcus sp. K1Tr]
MTNITIFEPETSSSLFSSQDALRIAAVMEALADLENYEALLFNLTDDAEQFESNKVVNEKIEAEGNTILPITVVDGEIVKTGAYPTNDEITGYIGVRFVEDTEGGCGCGGHGHHDHHHGESDQAKGGCGCGGHGHHQHNHGESGHAKGGCGCGGHGHHHHHQQEEEATSSKGSCACGNGGCC